MTTSSTSHTLETASDGPGLHHGFLRSALLHPNRSAVEVDGDSWTYADLRARAAAIAATVQQRTPPGGAPLTAVFARRSATAFAGTLASLMAGRGYVPLNRTFPTSRTRSMLERADCRALVVDSKSEPQLEAILEHPGPSMLVVLPERDGVGALSARWPEHTFVGCGDLAPASAWTAVTSTSEDVAYLLFTSGSTGTPKGVAVTHGNVRHFVAAVVERYSIGQDDRFSQMFDPTFDLSVFDMFTAWSSGACICCPSESALLNPDKFIRESKPTVWLSVPSVAVFMKRFGVLRPGRFPSLRWSLFCGEPLPADIASAWSDAAPGSTVENLYGPTEVTVACLAYRWDRELSSAASRDGIVPIGSAFPGMDALVVDEHSREVPPGSVGELLMAGPQVTPGYWRDAVATARSYVTPEGKPTRYYRTGDRVRRPVDDEPLTFVGRLDHQIKVLGHRLELGEVESRLRAAPGVDSAAAVAWPLIPGGASGVVGFVTGSNVDPAVVRAHLLTTLPPYAVPRAVYVRSDLPLNANGKVDRPALTALLRDESPRA